MVNNTVESYIYTADLHPPGCGLSMFADDVAIIADGLQHRRISRLLNVALEYIDKFYDVWHLKLNHSKTTAAFFPLDWKKRRVPTDPLTFADQTVPFEKEIKYLGVTFDDKLSFKSHILKARQRAIASTIALRPLLGRSST